MKDHEIDPQWERSGYHCLVCRLPVTRVYTDGKIVWAHYREALY